MIDWNKIKRWKEAILKNKKKLTLEKDFIKREKIRHKITIDEIRIKLEKLD